MVKDPPSVTFAEAEEKSLYTVVMTDPDAPSRKDPKYREWVHWGVCNIPGSDLKKGDLVIEYVGAGPPPETGLHRYFVIASKQKDKIKTYPEKKLVAKDGKGEGRPKNNFQKFCELQSLVPVAFNCFQAEYDDYCPELYKYLGLR